MGQAKNAAFLGDETTQAVILQALADAIDAGTHVYLTVHADVATGAISYIL